MWGLRSRKLFRKETIQKLKNTGKKAGKPSCPEKQTQSYEKKIIALWDEREVKKQVA